tara:strand:+ start:101 stop:283 length:183 start_codon:yes stop_codon:yes gene_type:complete
MKENIEKIIVSVLTRYKSSQINLGSDSAIANLSDEIANEVHKEMQSLIESIVCEGGQYHD